MKEENFTWERVEELFNSSVRKLSSASAEIKLLSTPELVKEYISKYELSKTTFAQILKKHK